VREGAPTSAAVAGGQREVGDAEGSQPLDGDGRGHGWQAG
jgi:hypothetical protein